MRMFVDLLVWGYWWERCLLVIDAREEMLARSFPPVTEEELAENDEQMDEVATEMCRFTWKWREFDVLEVV